MGERVSSECDVVGCTNSIGGCSNKGAIHTSPLVSTERVGRRGFCADDPEPTIAIIVSSVIRVRVVIEVRSGNQVAGNTWVIRERVLKTACVRVGDPMWVQKTTVWLLRYFAVDYLMTTL